MEFFPKAIALSLEIGQKQLNFIFSIVVAAQRATPRLTFYIFSRK